MLFRSGEVVRLRAAGRKVCFTNGCFDILHPGHVQYLQFARDQGDLLVLGLNSDASVRRNKGPKRPINSQADRAVVLSALSCVDYIVTFDQDTPYELIGSIQPDVLVKGADWAGNVVGGDIVQARGGKVVLADLVPGASTTSIIDKVLRAEGAASQAKT